MINCSVLLLVSRESHRAVKFIQAGGHTGGQDCNDDDQTTTYTRGNSIDDEEEEEDSSLFTLMRRTWFIIYTVPHIMHMFDYSR